MGYNRESVKDREMYPVQWRSSNSVLLTTTNSLRIIFYKIK
jgi:hypothetical protein